MPRLAVVLALFLDYFESRASQGAPVAEELQVLCDALLGIVTHEAHIQRVGVGEAVLRGVPVGSALELCRACLFFTVPARG